MPEDVLEEKSSVCMYKQVERQTRLLLRLMKKRLLSACVKRGKANEVFFRTRFETRNRRNLMKITFYVIEICKRISFRDTKTKK